MSPARRLVNQTTSPTVAAAAIAGPRRCGVSPVRPTRQAAAWIVENIGWLLNTTCVVSARRTDPPLMKK